jgi:hypothetical protein
MTDAPDEPDARGNFAALREQRGRGGFLRPRSRQQSCRRQQQPDKFVLARFHFDAWLRTMDDGPQPVQSKSSTMPA